MSQFHHPSITYQAQVQRVDKIDKHRVMSEVLAVDSSSDRPDLELLIFQLVTGAVRFRRTYFPMAVGANSCSWMSMVDLSETILDPPWEHFPISIRIHQKPTH